MTRQWLCLLLLCVALNGYAANTLRIINEVPSSVADPTNVVIQLTYAETAALTPALDNYEVVYPFSATSGVWTLEIGSVRSGNLVFGIDPTHAMTAYSKVGKPDVHLFFNGLIEFTLLTTDTVGYWDLSNVDWIGMLCRLTCVSNGAPPDSTWQLAYRTNAPALIGMVTSAYEFTAGQLTNVLMHPDGCPSNWVKLMAPNIERSAYVSSPGGTTHLVNYFNHLVSNDVPLHLKANIPSTDTNHFTGANPPDWTNRVAALGATPATFTGGFRSPGSVEGLTPPIPGPGTTNQIMLILSNEACYTVLYYSTNALNPETVYRSDSDDGLWVRYCTDTNAGTWVWVMTNRNLNCVSPGQPSFFEDWIASMANKICYSVNAGLIPTNSTPAQVYTFSGYPDLVPTETNTWQTPPYDVNMYNRIIVTNSDSYGMSFSDADPFGSGKVVKQTMKNGGIVELRLLNPEATSAPVIASVVTRYCSNVTGTAAAGGGIVTHDGGVDVTARGVCWSTAANPSTADSHTTDGFGTGAFVSAISGLNPGAIYHVRAYAVNSAGAGYGAEIAFTTLAVQATGTLAIDVTPATGSWEISAYPYGYTGPLSGTGDLAPAGAPAGNYAVTYRALAGYVTPAAETKELNAGETILFSGVYAPWAPVAGDYDGDGLADPATYNAATGTWKVRLSSTGYIEIVLGGFLGGPDFVSAAADYDGDGRADPGVYGAATGEWIVLLSSSGYSKITLSHFLGGPGQSPCPADYDGDRKAGPAVYDEAMGDWKVMLSRAGYYTITLANFLGGAGNGPCPADYDGDKLADPAVYAEATGNWVVLLSKAGYFRLTLPGFLGGPGFLPVPGDYDGDGLADPTVRKSDGSEWRIMLSGSGYALISVPLGL